MGGFAYLLRVRPLNPHFGKLNASPKGGLDTLMHYITSI